MGPPQAAQGAGVGGSVFHNHGAEYYFLLKIPTSRAEQGLAQGNRMVPGLALFATLCNLNKSFCLFVHLLLFFPLNLNFPVCTARSLNKVGSKGAASSSLKPSLRNTPRPAAPTPATMSQHSSSQKSMGYR